MTIHGLLFIAISIILLFQVTGYLLKRSHRNFRDNDPLKNSESIDCGCEGPVREASIGTTKVSAAKIRSLNLIGYDGKLNSIGTVMGSDKSVVVFLRHLG